MATNFCSREQLANKESELLALLCQGYGGGHLPFVGKTYMMRIVNKFASVISFTEHLSLVLLDFEEGILQGNGNFRRPGENRDIFPLPIRDRTNLNDVRMF